MSEGPSPVGGTIADRYVLSGQIGAGGMGVVYRARDERLGREVAVKLLPASTLGDAQARRRLLREARSAAGLEHAGIVHVYDVGETADGGAFLVMELIAGQSLRDHILRGTLAPRQRLGAIVEVGRALGFAHSKGFVHRDVKPDNIMIRDDGRAVVLDFGLAKERAAGTSVDAATVTAGGMLVGTPAYMAPEQARGEAVDAPADQFALAVTTFEAATGQLPWRGSSPLEVVSDILHGTPKRLRDVRTDLPAALEDAVTRALSKQPQDRFPTVLAFVDALEAAMQGIESSLPRPAGRAAHDVAHAPTMAASVSGAVAPAPPAPRGRPRWTLAVAGALALGIVGAVWLGAGSARRSAVSRDVSRAAIAHPLSAVASVLACPALAATAYDFRAAEWLGAGAAHLACERAQVALGDAARTLVPAELLALPRSPGGDFPVAPFDGPGARGKMLEAAAHADAWLDGSVDRRPEGFRVVLALRARGGAEVSRGEGQGVTLLRAVRSAMDPLLSSGAIPRVADQAILRAWSGGASVDAALALHDLNVAALAENPEAVREECGSVRARLDLGEMRPFVAAFCADRLGEPLPPRPDLDERSLGALATSAAALRVYDVSADADRARLLGVARSLESDLDGEPSLAVRALRAAMAAEVRYALGDADGAQRAALSSIQASPKEVDVRGTAWHRLSFTSKDTRQSVLAPHTGWLPWEPFAHYNSGRVKGDPASLREGAHRASALGGRSYWLVNYGEIVLSGGDVVGASAVAAEAHSPSLTVRVMRADGQLRGALQMAITEIGAMPARLDTSLEASKLAAQAAELSAILELPSPAVEDFVNRFVVPEPSIFSRGVVPLFASLAACVQSPNPLGTRCVKRIAELFRAGHFGAGYVGAADAIEGAGRYVAGDFPGAARAWRGVFGRSSIGLEQLRTPLADAFDRAGDPDVAERVDAPAIEEAALPSLALVRAATRAARRGDCGTARRLALILVDKWDLADEKPPAVDRMKKLAARCAR